MQWGKELPGLKIAPCLCRDRREKRGREAESGGATVLLCLPAGLIWSPVLLRLVPRSSRVYSHYCGITTHYSGLFSVNKRLVLCTRGTTSSGFTQTNNTKIYIHKKNCFSLELPHYSSLCLHLLFCTYPTVLQKKPELISGNTYISVG